MEKSVFTIESIPGQKFEGYTNGDEWNGWACPYFTFEVGQKIVEAQATGSARYDDENDQFVFTVGGDDIEVYPAEITDGKKLYSIGCGTWIWEISRTLGAKQMNDSVKLAKLWLELGKIKETLDNEIIPVSGYLQVDDDELITAMEELSERIGNHFAKFRLTAEISKVKSAESKS